MAARTTIHAVPYAAALILAAVALPATVSAQDCIPADITLGSQAVVDTFQTDHGPCDRVTGELRVEGEDITSLAGLSALTEIYRLRVWTNPLLPGLAGLDAVRTAGLVHLQDNPALTDLAGLGALTDAGELRIARNGGLLRLHGLEALQRLGYLIVSNNDSLRSLAGLSSLERVGANEFRISNNRSLESLDGLQALHTVVGHLIIEDNGALKDIDALSSLTTATVDAVSSIEIKRNGALTNLDGLASLKSIPGSLIIHLNDALTDLGGLSNLAEVGAMLHIAANPALTSLDGLEALKRAGSLGIVNNASLADVTGLAGLETVGAWFEISWNPKLTGLDGLSALKSVGLEGSSMGALIVRYNQGLQSLAGLSGLKAVQNLALEYNPALSHCSTIMDLIDPLDDFEPGPGPGLSGIPDVGNQARIQLNGAGCNSVGDILAQAPLLQLNAGLNDAWFDPSTAGQGILLVVLPDIRKVFLAWFTYDAERPPPDVTAQLGEPGHRWLTAQGEFEGQSALLTIHVAEGGVFDSAYPAPSLREDGEILLEFSTCNAGTVTYDIPSAGLQGLIPIERIVLDNVPLCHALEKAEPLP